MTFYLRNSQNKTIFDAELNLSKDRDLRCVVVINEYSHFLLENIIRKEEIINDFYNLSELREWFHTVVYHWLDQNIINELTYKLTTIAMKYDLLFITD